ncbi:hypothetical protein GYMLUDRAFT_75328 [Collybiopsis luxurians FD-317 M1]|uniref:Uncharacterized protein n=1 Tax=Collybiopsis luxurians FD-317 M1 TaxID=944289 RepID=A0A0D0B382_9AGAR|nr:hypothetical protein GYMLUDRAFT_75328 [Collybiopsis luxurians FD-317 M1]
MTYRPNNLQQGKVTDMLHTLRGEQFRHSQNVNGTRVSFNAQGPSYSTSARFLNLDYSPPSEAFTPLPITVPVTLPGPPLPKSWQPKLSLDKDVRNSAAWRAEALSLIFEHRPSSQKFTDQLPSLTQLCFRRLLECSTEDFIEYVVPCLPAHLRLELIRHAAIHRPLSDNRLEALLGSEGHAHGELLVVGPSASLPADRFLPLKLAETTKGGPSLQQESPIDWDLEDFSSVSLQSLIILSGRLSSSRNLTGLPPTVATVTHMTLVNLENPIALHRLPSLCPLLVFLDLSYNKWLSCCSDDTLKSIERIEWDRWRQLRILGWRENSVPEGMVTRLNKGRWDDVEVFT